MNMYPILLLTACLTAGCGGVGGSDGARQLGFYSEMARSYYDENDGVPTGRRSLVGASTPRWLAHTTTRTTVCPPDGVLSSDSYFFNPNIGSTIEYLQMQLLR